MSTFRKDDQGKNMLGCLPPRAMLAVGRVLTWGARKYGRANWSNVDGRERYYDATLRHLFTWWSGEDRDPDTRESHLAHAICCLSFLLELETLGILKDDRPDPARMRLGSAESAIEFGEFLLKDVQDHAKKRKR